MHGVGNFSSKIESLLCDYDQDVPQLKIRYLWKAANTKTEMRRYKLLMKQLNNKQIQKKVPRAS